MSDDQIQCAICGDSTHIIQVHLKESHPEVSVSEYRADHPEAPIMSDKAAKAKASHDKGKIAKAEMMKSKSPMADLFKLGSAPAAKTEAGDDIMISVMEEEGYEDFIPLFDDNYIFDIDLLKTCLMALEVNIPCYLHGHSGVGKSTIWENICAATKRRLLRVQHTINTEEAHIVGQWTAVKEIDPNGYAVSVTRFELGPLPMAMKNGWTFLADEYDRGHPSVLSCYQAVLEGKPLMIKEADEENRVIRPHKNFRIVGTGNSNGSGDETGLYQATIVQDAATFERFGVVDKVGYMEEAQEIAMVMSQAKLKKPHAKKIVSFCRDIRARYPQDFSLTPGPRVAINMAKLGLMKSNFNEGVRLAFAERLPESERQAAIDVAQRIFG